MQKLIDDAYVEIGAAIEKLEFKDATEKAIRLIEEANKYYDERKPWIQFKEDINAFNDTIYTCANLIANISNIMEPFMPASSEKIRKILNIEKATWNSIKVEPHIKLDDVEILFTKFDEKEIAKEIEAEAKERAKKEKELAKEEEKKKKENEKKEEITIDYLDKISLKVAKILEAERVEGSEKLLKLQVSLGDEKRQVVAGLQKYYKPEELIGKKVVMVANLKKAKLKGIESEGMLLAAGDGETVKVLIVDDLVKEGEDIH